MTTTPAKDMMRKASILNAVIDHLETCLTAASNTHQPERDCEKQYWITASAKTRSISNLQCTNDIRALVLRDWLRNEGELDLESSEPRSHLHAIVFSICVTLIHEIQQHLQAAAGEEEVIQKLIEVKGKAIAIISER